MCMYLQCEAQGVEILTHSGSSVVIDARKICGVTTHLPCGNTRRYWLFHLVAFRISICRRAEYSSVLSSSSRVGLRNCNRVGLMVRRLERARTKLRCC